MILFYSMDGWILFYSILLLSSLFPLLIFQVFFCLVTDLGFQLRCIHILAYLANIFGAITGTFSIFKLPNYDPNSSYFKISSCEILKNIFGKKQTNNKTKKTWHELNSHSPPTLCMTIQLQLWTPTPVKLAETHHKSYHPSAGLC